MKLIPNDIETHKITKNNKGYSKTLVDLSRTLVDPVVT